jgi:hypothetical protein
VSGVGRPDDRMLFGLARSALSEVSVDLKSHRRTEPLGYLVNGLHQHMEE